MAAAVARRTLPLEAQIAANHAQFQAYFEVNLPNLFSEKGIVSMIFAYADTSVSKFLIERSYSILSHLVDPRFRSEEAARQAAGRQLEKIELFILEYIGASLKGDPRR
jgi:hypothetical protein